MKNQTARRKTAKKQTETTPKRHTNRRLTGKFTYSDFDKNNKNSFTDFNLFKIIGCCRWRMPVNKFTSFATNTNRRTSCVEISKSKNIKKPRRRNIYSPPVPLVQIMTFTLVMNQGAQQLYTPPKINVDKDSDIAPVHLLCHKWPMPLFIVFVSSAARGYARDPTFSAVFSADFSRQKQVFSSRPAYNSEILSNFAV